MNEGMIIRPSTIDDLGALLELYRQAATPGGMARSPEEIDEGYVSHFLRCDLERGISLAVEEGGIIAETHAHRPGPRSLSHVLSDLTICVHPGHRSRGVGRALLRSFMGSVADMPDIHRVELIARETNRGAIDLYLSEGFHIEGRLRKRIEGLHGKEDDILMVWVR